MLSRCKAKVKEGLFALMVGLFQEITDVVVAVIFAGRVQGMGLTAAKINHKIYTSLMYYGTEFRMTFRDLDRNAFY